MHSAIKNKSDKSKNISMKRELIIAKYNKVLNDDKKPLKEFYFEDRKEKNEIIKKSKVPENINSIKLKNMLFDIKI
jgi:hypothetical protein